VSLHTGYSHSEVWLRLLEEVQQGQVVSPRGMKTFELPWTQIEVANPMTFPMEVVGRKFKDVIGVLEGLSLVGEFNVPELFTDRVSKFAQFMDEGILWGAYGQRAHGALGGVVHVLNRDPDSRQAVITFFNHDRDLDRDKQDIPCTISAQFLLRERKNGPDLEDREWYLDLGISMRSNDLWLGTPYDFIQFSILQATVAQALGARVGRYVHRVGSLHLYERDVEKTEGLEFLGGPEMPFPLWGAAGISHIQSRARMLALGALTPVTPFESWAYGLIHGN
jgi:thymidylate synthase